MRGGFGLFLPGTDELFLRRMSEINFNVHRRKFWFSNSSEYVFFLNAPGKSRQNKRISVVGPHPALTFLTVPMPGFGIATRK